MSLIRSVFISALLLVPFLSINSANAVSFDFAAYAVGNEHGATSETLTMGGVSVTVTGYDLFTNATYLAYFDDYSGGSPGGLGVCKGTFFPGGECSEPPDDDDLGFGEVLKLVFDQPVTLTDLLFRNGNHDLDFLGNFGVLIDAAPANVGSFTQYLMAANFAGPLTGTTFYFISNATIIGDMNNDVRNKLYLSGLTAAPVPEPLTMSLVGVGLIGALRRRRSA